MRFCYVILHYKTEDDTIACINSIFDVDKESSIVVVDNASNNGSIEQVEEVFGSDKRVHFIKNKENLGFAAGNNVGYQYARNNLYADFIAISNNDIIVKTQNFSDEVRKIYEKTGFFVMGPDIVSLVDGGHQNPVEESFQSAKEVRREILKYKVLLTLSGLGIYQLLKPKAKVKTGSSRMNIPTDITENVTVHGSFVIFSPAFIEKEEVSFRYGTFLYTEEAILKKYCDNQKYKMIFAPTVSVQHKEDSATNSLKLTTKEKREFVFKNMIRSLSEYLKYFNLTQNYE